METINNLTKRKKRKTRKCLDELRKRSRRNTSGNCIDKSSQQLKSKVCIMGCKSNSNNLITSNRLTLQATFPKAIRSETITRPALAEIKQKKDINLVDFVRDKVSHNCIPPINKDIARGAIINDFNTVCISDYKQSPNCKKNICNTKNDDAKSPDCYAFIASPTNQPLEVSKTPIYEDTSIVTSPSQSLQGESGNCLYEEFMNEMCSHFRELTPSIIEDDVIKNTYCNLKRIYKMSCENEYEENILNCISGSMTKDKKKCSEKNTIEQNPMDYIRVEHARKQNTLRVLQQHAVFSESSSSSSMQSPATPLLASQTPRAKKLNVVLYDTPEYNYYPHKLN